MSEKEKRILAAYQKLTDCDRRSEQELKEGLFIIVLALAERCDVQGNEELKNAVSALYFFHSFLSETEGTMLFAA